MYRGTIEMANASRGWDMGGASPESLPSRLEGLEELGPKTILVLSRCDRTLLVAMFVEI